MKILGKNTGKGLKIGFLLALIGVFLVPFALNVEEPARILLLGAALVGLGVWGKRHIGKQRTP